MRLDFLIVGAMKAGTTSLGEWLGCSAHIAIPSKEIHYFNNNFEKGRDWYERQLCLSDCNPKDVLIGEKTPSYSYVPCCAERIHSEFPEVKIIWIFRDPIKRAFSNYLHAVKKGRERRSFEYCVLNESKRMKSNIFKGYCERSKYDIQVEHFLKYFTIEQMHFLRFEEVVADPKSSALKIFNFLNLKDCDILKLPFPHSNSTRLPFSKNIQFFARKYVYDSDKHLLYRAISSINKNVSELALRKYRIDSGVRNYLKEIYKPHNDRLANLTGLDFASWDS